MIINKEQETEKRVSSLNMNRTKMMTTDKKKDENIEVGRSPTWVCGSRGGVNSLLCTKCDSQCHKRCSGLRPLHV